MNKEASNLLQEMKTIFGTAFGGSSSTETVITEARRPMPAKKEASKGKLLKKKGGSIPTRKGKHGLTLKAKRALKKKSAEGEKRFQGAMKDIRGEMDKSHKKSMAKSGKGAGEMSGFSSGNERPTRGSTAGKLGRLHYPFKRNANLGPGPRSHHHDETKCWKCKCGNIYSEGCHCVASGNGENCPPKGTTKKISFNKSYKQDYNSQYHAWRARKGGAVTRRLGSTR